MHLARLFIPLLTAGLLTLAARSGTAAPNRHEQITGPFVNTQAVTMECLGCHAQQGADILQSSH